MPIRQLFLKKIREQVSGDAREQRAARRLAVERPGLEAVIRSVEKVRGERWEEFRDRYGDGGRDLVLYVGRRACGMKLREPAEAIGIGAVVAMGVKCQEAKLKRSPREQEQLKQNTSIVHF